jgi:26S proteasome regulatory subunit T3
LFSLFPVAHFFFLLADVSRPDKISGADIHAICQEAGMQAVRKNRYVILPRDFEKGYKANVKGTTSDFEFYK